MAKILKGLFITSLLIFFTNPVKANDSSCVQLLKQAREHIAVYEYSKAILLLDSCLKVKDDDAIIYNLRGCATIHLAFTDKKNNQTAIQFFTKAIRIDSNNYSYYNNRGWAYQNLGNYTSALKDFRKALSLDTTKVYLHGNVLRTFWLQNKNKEAYVYCNKIILQFPGDGYAYFVRGMLKRDYLHKYPEGEKDIKKSKELEWERRGMPLYY